MKKATLMTLALLCLALGAPAQSFSTTLTGTAEAPGPGDPDGIGIAVITIDGTMVHYSFLVQNISAPTGAHIHRGTAGAPGGVVVSLAPSFNGGNATGTVASDPVTVAEILGNPAGFYVNVHTAEFSDGAIRGQLAPSGTETTWLPVVGKVIGANNTNFVTDLSIVNGGDEAANVTLEYFPASPSGLAGPSASSSVSVPAGSELVINDLVGSELSTSGLGALRITSTRAVGVNSRIFNDLRSEGLGTTGFLVPGLGGDEAAMSGTLPFLSSASAADIGAGLGFRTNVGYFNANAFDVTVTFTARRSSDGTALGSNSVVIPAYSQLQQGVFGLISNVPEADRAQANYFVTYTADAAIFVYGAVTDNKTGDGVFVQ